MMIRNAIRSFLFALGLSASLGWANTGFGGRTGLKL